MGKSTLVNTLIGEERVIAFDMPGTTRDAIEVPFERNGRHYTLIDTAGLRKRSKVFEAVEKFSVIKTLQAVEQCNVVVLVLDASQEISDQDAHIGGSPLKLARARCGSEQVGQRGRLSSGAYQRGYRPEVAFSRLRQVSVCLGLERAGYRSDAESR